MINLAKHRWRVARLVAGWQARQGADIEQTHGPIVASACRHAVARLAWRHSGDAPLPLLTAAEIQTCEDRVVSSERNVAFGPYALRRLDDGLQWSRQTAEVRALVRTGQRPEIMSGGEAPRAVDPDTAQRLADLARAHRAGRPPPERRADGADEP